MSPIEQLQPKTSAENMQQQIVPNNASISLSMLIDFIVQRTYHDLTVLAEL